MKLQYAVPYFENDVLYIRSSERIFVIQSGIAPGHLSSIRYIPSSRRDVPYASDVSVSSLSLQQILLSKVTLKSELAD